MGFSEIIEKLVTTTVSKQVNNQELECSNSKRKPRKSHFMYTETRYNNHDKNAKVSFAIIHIHIFFQPFQEFPSHPLAGTTMENLLILQLTNRQKAHQ